MDNEVLPGLKKLWAECGENVNRDASRFKGLIRDFCPHTGELEINVLVMSVQNGLLRELMAVHGQNVDEASCMRILARFINATGVKDEHGKWVLGVWAEVLGKRIPAWKNPVPAQPRLSPPQAPPPVPPVIQLPPYPAQPNPPTQSINLKSVIIAVGLVLLGGGLFSLFGGTANSRTAPASNAPTVVVQAQNPARQPNASSPSVISTQPSPTAQPPQPTIPAPQVAQLGAEGMARRAVLRFYELIDSRNYSAAYAMFSQEWRSKISFESWRNGFSSTLGNQVNRASVVGVVGPGDKECTVRFQLTSRDRVDNGKVLVQIFQGEWYLRLEDGSWKLHDADVKLADKRYE